MHAQCEATPRGIKRRESSQTHNTIDMGVGIKTVGRVFRQLILCKHGCKNSVGQGAMAPPLFILFFQGLRLAVQPSQWDFLKDLLASYWGCGLSKVGVAF